MKIRTADPKHEVVYQDLIALIGKHGDKVSKPEFLAVAANLVGKIIAMQDQRTMTKDMAMLIVFKNIQRGNEQVIMALGDSQGQG